MRTSWAQILICSAMVGILTFCFQNCSSQTSFSGNSASSSNSPTQTSSNQCLTYASVASGPVVVSPGTVIQQSIGCNGTGANTGFQSAYCSSQSSNCVSCENASNEYVCGSDGTWALADITTTLPTPAPTPRPTATPVTYSCASIPAQGCAGFLAQGGCFISPQNSVDQCQQECANNAALNPGDAITCYYNGAHISY